MDIIKVKCDPHSADVEIDSGAGVYDDGKNKSLSVVLEEFNDWPAVYGSVACS